MNYELLQKVKKSNVIHVEAVVKSDLKKNKTEIPLREIMNQLSWKEPPFEDAAVVCNNDGSKTATVKSKFQQSLLTNFANLHVSQEKEIKSMFPTGTELLSDFHKQLHWIPKIYPQIKYISYVSQACRHRLCIFLER